MSPSIVSDKSGKGDKKIINLSAAVIFLFRDFSSHIPTLLLLLLFPTRRWRYFIISSIALFFSSGWRGVVGKFMTI